MSCSPQPLRRVQRIDIEVLPPCEFVTALVKLAMMKPAERDGEFVTHLGRLGIGRRTSNGQHT